MYYNFYINYFINVIVIFLLKIFINNYNIFEVYSKNSQNENFFEFFVFLWTNYWTTLFFFFSFFFIFYYFHFLNSKIALSLIIFFLTYFYVNELSSFFNDNFQFQFFNLIFYNQSFLLLNNLNKIHPFLLYASAAFFVQLSFQTQFSRAFNFLFIKKFVSIKLRAQTLFLFYLITTAIFLGAWWAEQEQSWNGWWNWDSSETLSLGIFFYCIFFFHFLLKFNGICRNKIINFNFFFFNLIFYILVQLNFEQTSHNFGLKFFFFFNNYYYLIFLSIIFLFTFIQKNNFFFSLSIFFYMITLNKAKFYRNIKYKVYARICLLLFLIKIFFISFMFNFNIKTWIVHAIIIFNTAQYFYLENLFLTTLILLYFFKIFFSFNSYFKNFAIVHFLILNFLLSSIFNSNYELVNPIFLNNEINVFFNYFFQIVSLNYVSELNFFIKEPILWYKNEILSPQQITHLFNFFENNFILSKIHLTALVSFFFKNNKMEIFEINGVNSLLLEVYFSYHAIYGFFFKPLWIN